jgi:hypothetical protein
MEINPSAGVISGFVATLALVFTVGSFYWMNWRKGKLIVGPPSTYGITCSANRLIVELPFIFFNNGATTKVIHNLRLTLEQNGEKSPILNFEYIQNNFTGHGNGEEDKLTRHFAIEGGKAYSKVFSFSKIQCGFAPIDGYL